MGEQTVQSEPNGPVSQVPSTENNEGLRILFIGNSLTYTNDLPGMLEDLFVQGGVEVDQIESIALPNFGLQDHWARTKVKSRIFMGGWDYVILQQGPSATEGRPSLIEYSALFDEIVRGSGGRTAIYMVWPAQSRFFDFDGVLDSHRTAANEIDAIFLPAGQAWRIAWAQNEELPLYSPDRFHPSAMGTYLAALVIYQKLSGHDPRELPNSLPIADWPYEVPVDEIEMLQRAAFEANRQFQ